MVTIGIWRPQTAYVSKIQNSYRFKFDCVKLNPGVGKFQMIARAQTRKWQYTSSCTLTYHPNSTTIYRLQLPLILTACRPGYIDVNCSKTCGYPTYGERCQKICNCSETQCDFSDGCPRSITKSGKGLIDRSVVLKRTYKQTTSM